MTAPLAVLAVCTGNVCRSPAAELLLREGLGVTSGVDVASAGLDALAGDPVAEQMSLLLRARGLEPRGFVSRQLEPEAVRRAGVVLTMTAAQRRAVVTSAPAAVRRTFTLREFALLAELSGADRLPGTPAERLAAVVSAAPRARALRVRMDGDDDIQDPYGHGDEVFVRVLDAIDEAVGRLLRVVRPAAAAPVAGSAVLAGSTRPGGDRA